MGLASKSAGACILVAVLAAVVGLVAHNDRRMRSYVGQCVPMPPMAEARIMEVFDDTVSGWTAKLLLTDPGGARSVTVIAMRDIGDEPRPCGGR